MANRMDVDDATTDDPLLNNNVQSVQRDSGTTAATEQGELIDFPESEQDDFAPLTDENLGGRDPKETAANKQKMSLFKQVPSWIGFSSRQRETQQESDSMNVEALRARLKAQRRDNKILEKKAKEFESQVELLESEIDSAKRVNEKLYRQNQDHVMEFARLMESQQAMGKTHEAEKQDFRKEIARLNEHIKTLTLTSDQLRQMLVPVSEKQVSDSDVVSRFTNLRSSIVALVRQTWKLALREDFVPSLVPSHERYFFKSPHLFTYDRLRFLVFLTIHAIIFDSQSYFLRDNLEQFEQHIQAVEKNLYRNLSEGDGGRLLEWRNATFKATETLRGDDSRLSSIAQCEIWRFLSPLQLKDAAAEQNGQKKLKAICDNAVELSLMIRQLKDEFWVDCIPSVVGKHISSCGAEAEETESLVADDDQQPGTIAYVITGALMKSPKEDLARILVLEKAQVAVYE